MSNIWRNSGIFFAFILAVAAVSILSACGGSPNTAPLPRPTAGPTLLAVNLAAPARAGTTLPAREIQVRTQGQVDLAIADLIVTQAVDGEPLVVGKSTVVRVVVAQPGGDSYPAEVTVDFAGKTYSATATIAPPQTTVDLIVDPPTAVAAVVVSAGVQPVGDVTDPNPANNSKSVTLAVVQPQEKIAAFFLPVDWTPEQMQRYDFSTVFPKFVQDQGDFLHGVYPLGTDQITLDYTLVPHMLAADEKRLADSQGDGDILAMHLLYASIALAGRRLAPSATLIVGIFPPGWFAEHGEPGTLGLSLRDVKGAVTDQYLPEPLVTAHELAHQFWLYEDYDYSITPPRSFTYIDRPGYWVQRNLPEVSGGAHLIPTFLSAGNPNFSYWVDTRIYEYLMAKFTIDTNGETSGPLVLAATMAREIEPGNYPSNYAAGFQNFEAKQPVYCSVAAADMKAGQTLEARWFLGDNNVKTERQTTEVGSAWYAFSLSNRDGLAEGSYHVEIYLDGQLVKVSQFVVSSNG